MFEEHNGISEEQTTLRMETGRYLFHKKKLTEENSKRKTKTKRHQTYTIHYTGPYLTKTISTRKHETKRTYTPNLRQ